MPCLLPGAVTHFAAFAPQQPAESGAIALRALVCLGQVCAEDAVSDHGFELGCRYLAK